MYTDTISIVISSLFLLPSCVPSLPRWAPLPYERYLRPVRPLPESFQRPLRNALPYLHRLRQSPGWLHCPDVIYQLNIKTAIGTVLINAVKKYFPGTELLTGLCKLQSVNVAAFSTAFYGALIPTVFFAVGARKFRL
jgi:hypothetical protein